ncbi:MAG: hypothetical protein ABIP06_04715 [Pyrinomonadaceae bacterium]
MKLIFFYCLLICSSFVFVAAQSPAPQRTPVSQRTPSPAEETRRTIRQQEDANRRFEALKNVGRTGRNNNPNRTTALQTISNIYRKPNKEESKLLAPDKEDVKKYAQFLRQANTGITKLITDKGCAEYTNILNVSDDCLKYSMPGAGSSFSFRTENYRIRRLSDLTYIGNSFQSLGILAHAILVNIGDTPIEQVSLQTNGVNFLTDFKISTEFEKAKEVDHQLIDGINNNGFFYSRNVDAAQTSTFVLRSIAYRGNYYRAVQGLVYDELDFDERRDVTVVFRIVRRDEESVTILWKQLANQKVPVLKRSNRDPQKIEENKFMAETEKKADN